MNTWRLFNLDYVLLAYTGQILKSMAPKHAQSHPTSCDVSPLLSGWTDSYMSSRYYRKSSLMGYNVQVFIKVCVEVCQFNFVVTLEEAVWVHLHCLILRGASINTNTNYLLYWLIWQVISQVIVRSITPDLSWPVGEVMSLCCCPSQELKPFIIC